jgi:Uma2 family endonuclease
MSTQQAHLVLGREDAGRLVSSADFAAAEFREPWKYERVEGRLVVMAPDGFQHQRSSKPWRNHLIVYELNHPDIVQDVFSQAWVRVDDANDRIGDIGVYLVTDQALPEPPDRAPDLMFEVVSPGREARERDFVKKRAEYHRYGIREYVVIDRFAKQVSVFTHTPTGYTERILTAADVYTSPLLPGLTIPLAEVFGN